MVSIEAPSDPSLLCSKLDYAAEKQKVLNINALGFEFYHSLWPLNLPVINYILLPSRKNKLSDGQFTLHMQNSSLRSKTLARQIPLFYFLGDGGGGMKNTFVFKYLKFLTCQLVLFPQPARSIRWWSNHEGWEASVGRGSHTPSTFPQDQRSMRSSWHSPRSWHTGLFG